MTAGWLKGASGLALLQFPSNMIVLPEHILRLMSPADRAKMGTAGMTAEEAIAAADARAEKLLQADIAQYLTLLEVEFIQPSMAKKSALPKGWTDFTLAYRGIPLAIEVKNADGKVKPEQSDCHERLRKCGWLVFVVRSLAEVQSILRGIDAQIAPKPTI